MGSVAWHGEAKTKVSRPKSPRRATTPGSRIRKNSGLFVALRSLATLSLPKFSRDKQCHFDCEIAAPLSPKDFNNIAQGRTAHPGVAVLNNRTHPERVQQCRGCRTPQGLQLVTTLRVVTHIFARFASSRQHNCLRFLGRAFLDPKVRASWETVHSRFSGTIT